MSASHATVADAPSRRDLLGRVLGAVTLGFAGWVAWRFADWSPAQRAPVLFPALSADAGIVARREEDVILVQQGDRAWAMSARCTHLGCAVVVAEDGRSLSCPCHGSRYSLEGEVLAGPANEPLPRLPHHLAEDGSHVVERS